MNIAIVGAGISGLGAARLLSRDHTVTVYEKSREVGGHGLTAIVQNDGSSTSVDIGVNVFSDHDYPLLMALCRELTVPLQTCDMSLSVSSEKTFEWSSDALLGQVKNMLKPRSYSLFVEFLRFYFSVARQPIDPALTVEEYCSAHRISNDLQELFLLPVGSAIWTSPPTALRAFQASLYFGFLRRHGIFSFNRMPIWYRVVGGVRELYHKLLADSPMKVVTGIQVEAVRRDTECVYLTYGGHTEVFDGVIFACHPDEVFEMLTDPSDEERQALSGIRYVPTKVWLHSDPRVMPRARACWASWNYSDHAPDGSQRPLVSYWVNKLHGTVGKPNLFVTVDPYGIETEHVLAQYSFSHPQFDLPTLTARERLAALQGSRNSWYCGAYMGYGFHEDGYRSAVEVVDQIKKVKGRKR